MNGWTALADIVALGVILVAVAAATFWIVKRVIGAPWAPALLIGIAVAVLWSWSWMAGLVGFLVGLFVVREIGRRRVVRVAIEAAADAEADATSNAAVDELQAAVDGSANPPKRRCDLAEDAPRVKIEYSSDWRG